MLPSPPLTADSCPSPRSLKRTYSDATDDAYTPPPSQPLKRRRQSINRPGGLKEDIAESLEFFFDASSLVTPPEYTHVPYDPRFGEKVCQQYKRSLRTSRTCDAIVLQARKQKYGEEDALLYDPGSTPDHIRQRYEMKQRELDELAADIIANSDSEFEEEEESQDSLRFRKKMMRRRKSGSQMRDLKIISNCNANLISSRDGLSAKTNGGVQLQHHGVQALPFMLRSDDDYDFTNKEREGGFVPLPRTGSALGSFRIRQQSRCQDFVRVVVS